MLSHLFMGWRREEAETIRGTNESGPITFAPTAMSIAPPRPVLHAPHLGHVLACGVMMGFIATLAFLPFRRPVDLASELARPAIVKHEKHDAFDPRIPLASTGVRGKATPPKRAVRRGR